MNSKSIQSCINLGQIKNLSRTRFLEFHHPKSHENPSKNYIKRKALRMQRRDTNLIFGLIHEVQQATPELTQRSKIKRSNERSSLPLPLSLSLSLSLSQNLALIKQMRGPTNERYKEVCPEVASLNQPTLYI